MNPLRPVAIVGLGMIGGSVARGLARLGVQILGYDSNTEHLDAAVADGVVTQRLESDLSNIGEADIVVIAVDGDSARDVLARVDASAGDFSLVTDVGSTKRTIVSAAERSSLARVFVGSHPFAGDHRSGWHASRAGMFANEIVYLSATQVSSDAALARAEELWRALGAEPLRMDAAAHDDLLAWTSHLPHIVSTAFALALADAGIDRGKLGRGGRDVARLAAGSPEIWTAIALDNAAEIETAVEAMRHQLGEIGALLRESDRGGLRARLARARQWALVST